jgi:cytochrome c553
VPALAVLSIATAAHAAVAQAPDFDRDVRPVLAAKCFACHGPDAEAREAGLRLDTFEGATTALRSGRRAVVPGDPAASVLLARVSAHDPDDRMPPAGEPLTGDEIESIRRWIEAGAAYTDPWAFQPMQAVDAPPVRDAAWCFDEASPIDRFVLATREAAGLAAPARDATPEALLRRLSFDLRGLPPDPADLAAFADDPSDARYDALVERYLADPAFGERWARHWLDLARYAETLGHEFDYPIPHAWRYRDWVIDAFNADLPVGRFMAEQIAGDLLEPRPSLGLANAAPLATAWWFLGPATHAPVDVRQDEADRIAGSVDTLGRSMLGMTVFCARCHDHKFDPIPASDFYAVAATMRNTRRVEGFLDTDPKASLLAEAARAALMGATAVSWASAARPEGVDVVDEGDWHRWARSGHAFEASGAPLALGDDGALHVAESGTVDSGRVARELVGVACSPGFVVDRRFLHVRVRGERAWLRVKAGNYWLDESNGLLFEGMRRNLGEAPEEQRSLERVARPWRIETFDLGRRMGERAYVELLDDGAGWIEVDWIAATDEATPPDGGWDGDGPSGGVPRTPDAPEARAARAARDALLAAPPPVRAIVALEGDGFDEPLHLRGVSRNYGEPVRRARLAALGDAGASTPVEGSGRLALAAAITDPSSPFLWRTTANRVWLKLFGRGIVETPDDFGQLGAMPWSRPLLDHLALGLARGGTFKSLVREIVGTHAYRALPDAGEEPRADAWAPLPVRRLDAESIRDAMLAASGRLAPATGGPGVAAYLSEHMQGRGRPGRSGPVDGDGRRSVYLEVRRNFLDPFLQAFDQPLPSAACGRRNRSNVPAQALALLNSALAHELATRWGERVSTAEGDDAARVEGMWMRAFARRPSADERDAALGLVAEARAAGGDAAAFAELAHALFAAKEFVFLR